MAAVTSTVPVVTGIDSNLITIESLVGEMDFSMDL